MRTTPEQKAQTAAIIAQAAAAAKTPPIAPPQPKRLSLADLRELAQERKKKMRVA